MSAAGKTTEALRATMGAAQVNGKTVYYASPEGSLAIVPWSEWERVCAVAKLEQLEQCDPHGTWYDVAQAALKREAEIRDLVKAVDARLYGQDRGGNTYPVELATFVEKLKAVLP
jgi:hypothetical protein